MKSSWCRVQDQVGRKGKVWIEGKAGKEGVNGCSTKSSFSDECPTDSLFPNILAGFHLSGVQTDVRSWVW